MLLALDEAMVHTRAEAEDAPKVELCLLAAEEWAARFLNRKLYPTLDAFNLAHQEPCDCPEPMVITPLIRAAILLLCGHLYANREAVNISTANPAEVPYGVKDLLWPYRAGIGV